MYMYSTMSIHIYMRIIVIRSVCALECDGFSRHTSRSNTVVYNLMAMQAHTIMYAVVVVQSVLIYVHPILRFWKHV